jgi:predicted AlkP superfamily phosphohydrolase/phosphomutase
MRSFRRKGQKNPLFSLNDVDWSRTKAYGLAGMGGININLAGREPEGWVRPGKEYESLKEEITEQLKSLKDPETGENINAQVFMKEEIYHGPYLDRAPDIMFLPNDAGYIAGNALGFTANKPIVEIPAWPGNHRMNGIFLAHGKHLQRGKSIEGASIMDLAPTILYLLGHAVPNDMDGKVLTSIFDEDFLASRALEYIAEGSQEEGSGQVSPEEEQEVIERLKELGYLM